MILGIFDPQAPEKGFHPFRSPKQEAKIGAFVHLGSRGIAPGLGS